MVLTYDFLIYSEVIRRDRAPFFPIFLISFLFFYFDIFFFINIARNLARNFFLVFLINEKFKKYLYLDIQNRKQQNKENKVQPVGSSLFLKYTTRTHSLSKKDQYTNYYT